MEFERQKPVTDEYREGWIRTFCNARIAEALTELDRIQAEDRAKGTPFHPDYFRVYPNGCPILNEERVDG